MAKIFLFLEPAQVYNIIMSEKPIEPNMKSASKRLTSIVEIEGARYLVATEVTGPDETAFSTRVYPLDRELLSRQDHMDEGMSKEGTVAFMQRQHDIVLREFVEKRSGLEKEKKEIFADVKRLMKHKKAAVALEALEEAIKKFPSDPFFMSYYGCLISVVKKRHREGVEACTEAIRMLDDSVPFGAELFYPVFYLNLGRAHLASGDRREAVNAFAKGMRFDPGNAELTWEMKKLGTRRKVPVPFLPRENLLNKYIGMLLSK